MSVVLHAWNTPNGLATGVDLGEMDVPYTVTTMSVGRDEHYAPGFQRNNPHIRIPVIVDSNGPDGEPITVCESGAILLRLGAKNGGVLRLSPREHAPAQE